MNSYSGEWIDNFNQIFYAVREGMKKNAWDKLSNHELPIEERVVSAEMVIKSHFLRSAYAFMEEHDRRRRHPSFREYAAMMLNQETYRDLFDEDVADALVHKYGIMEGIAYGTYYLLKKK